MEDFLSNVNNKLPLGNNFTSTVTSCGGQAKNIDILIRGLSWANKLSPTEACDIAVQDFFDSPDIHFNFICKFWHPYGNNDPRKPTKNMFHLWINLICNTINSNGVQMPYIQYVKTAYNNKRLDSNDPPVNIGFTREEARSDTSKTIVEIRKKFKENLLKYKKYIVSWPKNQDATTFDIFMAYVRTYLFVQINSEEDREFAFVFRTLETSLGSLVSYEMGGRGLPPMIQWFGKKPPVKFTDALSGTNNMAIDMLRNKMLEAKQNYEDSEREIKSLENEFERQVIVGKLNEPGKEDELKQAKQTRDQIIYRKRRNANNELLSDLANKTSEAFWVGLSDVIYDKWPSNIIVPIRDEGFLDRWYGFASQYWLDKEHKSWFNDMAIMSRSEPLDEVFQNTVCVLVDDASPSASKFMKYGFNVLLMPTLISNPNSFVHVCRNISPWWRPPEIQELTSLRISEAKVIVENINKETERVKKITQKLDAIKKFNFNLSEKENVVFYTTFPEIIGYCLYNNIEINVYNKWINKTPINTNSLREQVLRQSGLLGSRVTRLVKDSTKILTYMVLMSLSSSSGLPFYSAFGWQDVLSKWFSLVKEYFKLNKADITSIEAADKTCAWLAREGIDGIIINKRLLIPLVSKILHSKFVGKDKPEIKYGVDFNLYSKKYLDWVEENRVGTGVVKPIPITSDWKYQTDQLFKSEDIATEKEKEETISRAQQEQEESDERIYQSDLAFWQAEKNTHDKNLIDDWEKQKTLYFQKRQKALDSWKEQEKNRKESIDKFKKELDDLNDDINKNNEQIQKARDQIVENLAEITEKEKIIFDLEQKIQSGDGGGILNAFSNVLFASDQDKINSERQHIQGLININDLFEETINKCKDQIQMFEKSKNFNESQILLLQTEINIQPVYDYNTESEYVAGRPKPIPGSSSYVEYGIPKPVKGVYDNEITEIENLSNLLTDTTLSTIEELNRKESSFIDTNLESKEEADLKDDINKKIDNNASQFPWYERVEWMYAQRQFFQDNYYAPKGDLEDFVKRFGIRFKDWTGVSNITINT